VVLRLSVKNEEKHKLNKWMQVANPNIIHLRGCKDIKNKITQSEKEFTDITYSNNGNATSNHKRNDHFDHHSDFTLCYEPQCFPHLTFCNMYSTNCDKDKIKLIYLQIDLKLNHHWQSIVAKFACRLINYMVDII